MLHRTRLSARSITRHPGASVLVVVVVALLIGANAAIFSAARAVLFGTLPYRDANRMVVLDMFDRNSAGEVDLAWADAVDWGRRSRRLEGLSPFLCWQDRLLMRKDSVERINVNFVPSSYLNLLGVKPQLGSLFSPAMDGAPGSAPYVVLTDHLWVRSFAADRAIAGRRIRLNNRMVTVLGVTPKGFYDFTQGRVPCDAWIPAAMAGDTFPPDVHLFTSRDENDWFAAARLAPGVTLAQAREEADGFGARLRREFPDSHKGYYPRVTPLRKWMFGDLYDGMKVLLLGGVLVLAIGCANLANLFLVQQAGRRGELAARLASGATRRELAWQVLGESVILAAAGGSLGVLLAAWGTRRLAGLLELAPYTRVALDGGEVAAAMVAAVLVGVLCGLPAAAGVRRLEAPGGARPSGAGARGGARAGRTVAAWGRGGLLVFEVAVVVVLLIVACLLVRSFWLLQARGVGFDTARLLTLRTSYKSERYKDLGKISAAMAEALRRIGGLPGVAGTAVWGPEVPGIVTQFTEVLRDGVPATTQTTRAELHLVSPGALRLLGIPLIAGREFAAGDTRDRQRVAVISQSLAAALWPGEDPIGKRLYRPERENGARVTVVGVVPNIQLQGRFVEGSRHIFFPTGQVPPIDGYLLVRAAAGTAGGGGASSLGRTVKEVIRQMDSQIPVYDVRTLDERLREQERPQRVNAAVVGGYSLLALALAVFGIYGTLAYSIVRQRAASGDLPASAVSPRTALRTIQLGGLAKIGGGLLLGLVAARALGRFLPPLLYGVTPGDPGIFAGVAGVVGALAWLATALPLRQAARVEPAAV